VAGSNADLNDGGADRCFVCRFHRVPELRAGLQCELAGLPYCNFDELVSLLSGIMQDYTPTQIRIQDASGSDYTQNNLDHTDHLHAARFALEAYWKHLAQISGTPPALSMYRGYYSQLMPANVKGTALSLKSAALNNYCVFDPATPTPPGCYTDLGGWGQRRYAINSVPQTLGFSFMNAMLMDTGDMGCVTAGASQDVSLSPCGSLSNSLWVIDNLGHLRWLNQCLTIPAASQAAGISGPVQMASCSDATSWVLMSNGMLVGSHGKVLQAATDGTLAVVDLFTYNDNGANSGGVGNLVQPVQLQDGRWVSLVDLTDLGYRWIH
jgi:hypothetical protein